MSGAPGYSGFPIRYARERAEEFEYLASVEPDPDLAEHYQNHANEWRVEIPPDEPDGMPDNPDLPVIDADYIDIEP